MTEQEKQDKLIDNLVLDLQSADTKVLTSAFKRVRAKGDENILPALFTLIENNKEEEIKKEAKKIILELKSTATIPLLLAQLNSDSVEVRELVLGAFWQTGFNAFEHIDKFVLAAVRGTYMEAVETFTIIDSLEGPFEEEPIIEGQLILRQYFADNNTDDEKYELMKSISSAINNYEQSI